MAKRKFKNIDKDSYRNSEIPERNKSKTLNQ